jgi:hypothetical protein
MPVIIATQEAEIRMIAVWWAQANNSQDRKRSSQKRAGGMTQAVGPEFKPQYRAKKSKKSGPMQKYMHEPHR